MRYCPFIKGECVSSCVFSAVEKDNKPVCMLNEVLWNIFLIQTGSRPVEKTMWESSKEVNDG